MAEAVVLATVGWVASPLVTKLINKACGLLGTSMAERMNKLEATVIPRLSLAIEKAENSPNKHKLQAWLQRLKGAYYDAEDAIDLLEYDLLEQKVKADRKELIGKARVPWCRSVLKRKLMGLIDKIIKIAQEASEFRDLLEAPQENATTSNPYRESISDPSGPVFGRKEDIETIAGLLRDEPLVSEPGPSTRPGISIIAITGRSGIGKTRLAQSVYEYIKEQKYFDDFSWVHAPRKFNAAKVVRKIVQNTKAKDGALHEANYDHSMALEALKEQMKGMLGSEKFLLVLDDFWCDDEDDRGQWERFICCLSGCSSKSKILLTTQNDSAVEQAKVVGLTNIHRYLLKELNEGQFLDLFMYYAWPSDCCIKREEFKNIGSRIAAKLKGDPGAAKLVGDRLRNKVDLRHWEEIAKKDWSGDNMKARIWSYQQLPVHLQRCFTYCCLFPKGCTYACNMLIHHWIAEGFIKPKDEEERMEDIGKNYLNELVCRFFLEPVKNNDFRIHDLQHDLGQQVRGDEFLRINGYHNFNNVSSSRIENIRHIHLSVSITNELKDKICLMRNLRTIICKDILIPNDVLQNILEKSKKLRVLYLKECDDQLPDCIGNLKHLRYIFVSCSLPLKFPVSICKLYLLQYLFKGNEMLDISNVGRLTSLQFLDKFAIRKKHGYELHQLENLNQLRGKLCITGLENVKSIEDASKAKMQSKRHLEALEFEWNSDERVIDDFQLLDTLQPHPNIRSLTINGFRGNRFPDWLQGQDSLQHLSVLNLYLLNNLKEMPHLHSNLSTLVINHLPQLSYFSENDLKKKEERRQFMLESVKHITEYMKSKYRLQLFKPIETSIRRYLEFVKIRLEATLEIYISSSQCENLYPEILKLDPWNIYYTCDQLLDAWDMCMRWDLETMLSKNEESKLTLPSSLTTLCLFKCGVTTDALSASIQCLVSLSELWLWDIQTITSLPPEEVLHDLKNLRYLHIKECFLLSSLGGIRALTSLTKLELIGCLNLNPSNGQYLPSSLETLIFEECACVDAILDRADLPILCVLQVMEYLNVDGLSDEKRSNRVLQLGRLPCLKELIIRGWNGRVEGLNSLTSLYGLEVRLGDHLSFPIGKCSIQIPRVLVDKPLLLKHMLSDETISSIESLGIVSFEGDSLNEEAFLSITSLKYLTLEKCNITDLPVRLKDLTSLQGLYLRNCPNLREVESLPKNLCELRIKDCPTLSKKFHNDGYHEVSKHQGETIVTFPKEGPNKPIQQVVTSHLKAAQQVPPNPLSRFMRHIHRSGRKLLDKTNAGPSQPTQQAGTSQPNPDLTPNPNQSSTTTTQRHIGIETIPHDSHDQPRPPSDVNTVDAQFKGQFDGAGPSGMTNEDTDDEEEQQDHDEGEQLETRPRRLLGRTP